MGEGAERNELCWCGSGKRRKRCHAGPAPKDVLDIDFGRPVTASRVEVDPDSGEARFYDADGGILHPQSQTLQRQVDRPKGPKSIFRVRREGGGPLSLTLAKALQDYDRLYVIDTNTRQAATGTLSVAVVAIVSTRRISDSQSLMLRRIAGAFELHNVRKFNPEVVAWDALISRIRSSDDYSPGWRIGIVVDSELDALTAWNARTRPLPTGDLLPINFTLMYASADKQRASMLNAALAACDATSTRMLEMVSSLQGPGLSLASPGSRYSAVRVWRFHEAEGRMRVSSVDPSERPDSSFLRVADRGRRPVGRLASLDMPAGGHEILLGLPPTFRSTR